MANTAVTVPAPPRQPHRFGLFSAVPVHEVTDPHQLAGIQWVPDTCERPRVIPQDCPCGFVKEFTPGQPAQDADPFTVLGTWTCPLGGFDPDEAQALAERNLAAGEQHAVEWAIWTGGTETGGQIEGEQAQHGPRFADPSTPVIGTVHCATDLFAVIEQYTAHHYTGAPLVHLPRSVLPYLAADSLITPAGQRLETSWGTPLVAGAGYAEANTGPDGTAAPVGSYWVYVTGAMQVYRSSVFTPPESVAGFARCNNEMVSLAERTYLVAWDCFTAAVLFEPCCACGEPTGVQL